MSNNTMIFEQIEELDVLKLTFANGESLTAKVINKLWTYCRLEYMGFTESRYKNLIGKSFTAHYGTRVQFDSTPITKIERIYREGETRETDLLELMEYAVDHDDREWFEELGKELQKLKPKEIEETGEIQINLLQIEQEDIINIISQAFYYEDIVIDELDKFLANMSAKVDGEDVELQLIHDGENFILYDRTDETKAWELVGEIKFRNGVM